MSSSDPRDQVPSYQDFMNPTLRVLRGLGEPVSNAVIDATIAETMSLPADVLVHYRLVEDRPKQAKT
jgi:hypothetical protein